jgi:glycosidase
MNGILLSVCGTPIIFYGDEFGLGNDVPFYEETKKMTLIDDKRYLNRGYVNWKTVDQDLKDPTSEASQIHYKLKNQISVRTSFSYIFSSPNTEPVTHIIDENGQIASHILAYIRSSNSNHLLMVFNLRNSKSIVKLPFKFSKKKYRKNGSIGKCTLGKLVHAAPQSNPSHVDFIELSHYEYHWLLLRKNEIQLK